MQRHLMHRDRSGQTTTPGHLPGRQAPARKTTRGVTRGVRAAAVALFVALPLGLAGCVELSRTETSRYGNPLQSYSSGPRNTFDAENYKPPDRTPAAKPWYQRVFDW